MKKLLKDRIDVLIEKAKQGDAKAQLKLAKCFYKGHLVEKSLDMAKYWAFKSIQNGNNSAMYYYKAINRPTKSFVSFCEKLVTFPIWEYIIGFALFCFMHLLGLDDNVFYNICIWVFAIGLTSFFISLLSGKIGELINKADGKTIGTVIGFFIVHILALWVTFG